MAHLVIMDDEGRQLLVAAAEMMIAALSARCGRVDHDYMLARSVEMSRLKVNDLLKQFEGPPLGQWAHLSEGERVSFMAAIAVMMEVEDDQEREAAFRSIRAVLFRLAPASTIEGAEGAGQSGSI